MDVVADRSLVRGVAAGSASKYLMTGDVLLWGPIRAGATLAALPVMLLYFIAQRFMVRGVTAGSVKG